MNTINDYLTRDVVLFMRDTIGEDEEKINKFFEMVKKNISIDLFETILKSWNQQEDRQQIAMAIRYSGYMHISRFLMLMDYLYVKHILDKKKGEN